jgi:hypothetical protein
MPVSTQSALLTLSRAAIDRIWPENSPPDRDAVIAAVADLLMKERRRSVDICRDRAALWRRTPSAHADMPAAREEARARANEATYLADLIESHEQDAN